MTENGVKIRLLPIDVRLVDVAEFRHLDGRRVNSQAWAAVQGAASESEGLALARIDGLLDTVSPESWVFAHELAHVAFWHLPEADQRAFLDLFQAARQVEWVWSEYQRSNEDEFFACSFQDYLREKYQRRGRLPEDSEGWWRRVRAYFQGLEATRDFAMES